MRSKIIIIIGLIFGIITALLIYGYLGRMRAQVNNIDYIEIVVAKQAIPAKTVITSAMVEKKNIPSAYRQGRELTDLKGAVGRVTLIPINGGESILDNQVIEIGDHREGLAYRIPEGKRAMSIPVDEVSGVAGLLMGGHRVDIITTFTTEENPSTTYTVVVLQDVEVLAVGRNLEGDSASATVNNSLEVAKTVTLAVTLEESLSLKTAVQKGFISLMLRSPIDEGKSQPSPFKIMDFLR